MRITTILKEGFIFVLLTIVVIFLLMILLSDFVPTQESAQSVQYTAESNVKATLEEVDAMVGEDEDIDSLLKSYTVDESDLKIYETAKSKDLKIHKGTLMTTDVFGPYVDDDALHERAPKDLDILGEEMESFGLIHVANTFNREAAVMCTAVDSKFTDKIVTPEERQTSLNDMIELALENAMASLNPGGHIIIRDGDVVSVDLVVKKNGFHGDAARTFLVGKCSNEAKELAEVTKQAFFEGLKMAKPGNRVGDIGYAIQTYAKSKNLGVVRELCGHGVGTSVHEDPEVPNFGISNTGARLKEGMVIAVEPMLTLGSPKIFIHDNDWTIDTKDGRPSAHFEHTVVVTADGYEILTGE